ncbi:unnamed protein product [Heterobilharzia americana]|nr:unnamed protein product [Heterobilharzia americana]CAH8499405.1 unnamed protein product [Heterobilharzia americana]
MTLTTKPDLDRLGYFKELSYHTIGDPYVDLGRAALSQSSMKGRQMYGAYTKTRCGLNDGYFSPFKRSFIGEALTDMTKIRHQERLKEKSKERPIVFFPPSGSKQLIGSGGYWGTFSGSIPHFSNESIQSIKSSSGKNFYTSPPKKGSGSGYLNITIGKFPTYVSEPYLDSVGKTSDTENHKRLLMGRKGFILSGNIDYFGPDPYKVQGLQKLPTVVPIQTKSITVPFRPSNPGKQPGGYKAGTFNPFPKYISDPYIDPYKRLRSKRESKVFIPSSGFKSARFESILTRNVYKAMNSSNYDLVKSVVYL